MNIERANRIGYAESLAHAVDLDLGTLVRSSRGVVPFAGSSAHAHGGSWFPERLPFDGSKRFTFHLYMLSENVTDRGCDKTEK